MTSASRSQPFIVLAVCVLAADASPPRGGGSTFDECVVDAGSFAVSACSTTGSGAMTGIDGTLAESSLVGADLEDMYLIQICDVDDFRASTLAANGGMALFDTQLFLFRRGTPPPMPPMPRGILGNDDEPPAGASDRSLLRSPSDDGSPFGIIPGPGIYFLAITVADRDPTSAGGDIFFLEDTEVSGPDGQGGLDAHTGWSGVAGSTGTYLIALEGTAFARRTDGSFDADCNDNGIMDQCDIAFGGFADDDGDGIPDVCQLVADLDDDGMVGFGDLLVLLSAWGPCAGDCPADLDGDGVVGFGDLLILLASWT